MELTVVCAGHCRMKEQVELNCGLYRIEMQVELNWGHCRMKEQVELNCGLSRMEEQVELNCDLCRMKEQVELNCGLYCTGWRSRWI